MKKRPENIQEFADEIQKFIDEKREPGQIIKARVLEINSTDNIFTLELAENFNFYRGALVMINRTSGSVQDKYSNILKILTKDDIEFKEGDTVDVDSSLMNLVIDRLGRTINRIHENDLDDNNRKILQHVLGNGEIQYNPVNVNYISKTLNDAQKDAVRQTLGAEIFHLIIGPPGTGKTYVITEIIQQLLPKNQILVTAWTNIAVDNILEKFKDLPPENILRIGSFKEINPSCQKFTLEKRREQSPDWKEVKKLEKLIKRQKQSIHLLDREKYLIKNQIERLKKEYENYKEKLDYINHKKEEYASRSLKYKPSQTKFNDVDKGLEQEWSKLINDSKNYSNLANDLINLEEWETSLPEETVLVGLESEIKKDNSLKLKKRITSPFRRKEYKKYLEALKVKEMNYQKIIESYDLYGLEKDRVKKDYIKLYGDDIGIPVNNTMKCEIKLLDLLERYIPPEFTFETEMYGHQSIIYESYRHYISSIEEEAVIIEKEAELFIDDLEINIRKYDAILNEIESLKELIEINENNKDVILAYIDGEILSKSRLFFGTVISSAHPILKDKSFDWVIMDEASQVASFMSLIPLLITKRFVLVGDNKQLQPIEESKLSDHLNLSIFNRLLNNFSDSSTFLDVQYRMNKGLANIAGELFYDGKLKTFPKISDQKLDCKAKGDVHKLLKPEEPVTFLDTSNCEYLEDGMGSGCENSKESKLVVRLIDMLLAEGIPNNEIGVITPYRRHKINVRNRLKELDIDVDTVYSFQGREKDVIILTFCNSRLGRLKPYLRAFIERPSQVNVALTRARKKLIIVGNSKTLQESRLLGRIIELVGVKNTVEYSDIMKNIIGEN